MSSISEPRKRGFRRGDEGEPLGRILDDARARSAFQRRQASNLWVQTEVLPAGHTIHAGHQQIEIERDSVMVFSDDAPRANWGHPCRYLLYEPGEATLYRTVEADFPPYLTDRPETFRAFHKPVEWEWPGPFWPMSVPEWKIQRPRRGERYAVLFSGASDNRHTNDLEFLYRVLVNDFGYEEGNVYVLNYDGTLNYSDAPHPVGNWPGDDTPYQMTVNAAGTQSELENVIDELKQRLGPRDSLLIHTNNHGGRDGDRSFLVTYSGPSYYEDEFAAKVGELPSFNCLIVMMEQCYAGGFNQPLIDSSPANRTSVASAAIATKTSIGGPFFDPFACDWISALHGVKPDGQPLIPDADSDGDGRVTAREAFDYADLVHHPSDTPNYSSSSAFADRCYAGTSVQFLFPIIRIYLEREWKGPWPDVVDRLSALGPEAIEVLRSDLDRRAELEDTIEKLVRQAFD